MFRKIITLVLAVAIGNIAIVSHAESLPPPELLQAFEQFTQLEGTLSEVGKLGEAKARIDRAKAKLDRVALEKTARANVYSLIGTLRDTVSSRKVDQAKVITSKIQDALLGIMANYKYEAFSVLNQVRKGELFQVAQKVVELENKISLGKMDRAVELTHEIEAKLDKVALEKTVRANMYSLIGTVRNTVSSRKIDRAKSSTSKLHSVLIGVMESHGDRMSPVLSIVRRYISRAVVKSAMERDFVAVKNEVGNALEAFRKDQPNLIRQGVPPAKILAFRKRVKEVVQAVRAKNTESPGIHLEKLVQTFDALLQP